ncbi:MAG: cation:proton antiporter [Acidobacteria bacterium]|nr:MAG: cation:proton antiporter [Acidobacteriota bacterium]
MPAPNQLLVDLFVIFAVTKCFGEIFERFSLPAVLGEILAGITLGPHALGLIHPSDTVYSLAQVSAIFLLFMVGLETSPQEIIQVGGKAIQVALSGMLLTFVLGFGYLSLRHQPAHEAMFLGTAMVATSVGITARVLSDMGLLQTPSAKIILASAVFDDVLGMLLLAFVVGVLSPQGLNWISISVLALEAIGFALFMIYVAPRVMRRVSPRLERLSTRNPHLVMALGICLLLSVAAEKVGLAAIIGAFFAGLIFAEYAHEWNLRSGVSAISELLTPYFFFILGAQLNIHLFTGPVLVSALVISCLAIFAKIVGCGVPLLSLGRDTALQVGVGMTPRGEVGLIVSLIGLQMKMISDTTYAVVVFMTGVTILVAPFLLRIVFHKERSAMLQGETESAEVALQQEQT